jgi:hypothetical protein
MSTIRERLQSTLAELQDELDELPELDTDTRARLQATLSDIRIALAEPQGAAEPIGEIAATAQEAGDEVPPAAEDEVKETSLAQRLNDATRELESTHPELATTLGGVINALAQMGI